MDTKDRKIENKDREFIKALKNERHSIQLQTTRYELLKHSNTITSISISTISNTIRKDLSTTYKKIVSTTKTDHFTKFSVYPTIFELYF